MHLVLHESPDATHTSLVDAFQKQVRTHATYKAQLRCSIVSVL
jgi:hypothetical protein